MSWQEAVLSAAWEDALSSEVIAARVEKIREAYKHPDLDEFTRGRLVGQEVMLEWLRNRYPVELRKRLGITQTVGEEEERRHLRALSQPPLQRPTVTFSR